MIKSKLIKNKFGLDAEKVTAGKGIKKELILFR